MYQLECTGAENKLGVGKTLPREAGRTCILRPTSVYHYASHVVSMTG